MKNFLFKLLFIVLAAVLIAPIAGVSFAPAFAVLVVAGAAIGRIKGAALFETIAPDLLKELETLKTQLKTDLTGEVAKQIQTLEDKIKNLPDPEKIKADIKVTMDARDKQTQKELDEMSAELKMFREQRKQRSEKSMNRQEIILKALEGKIGTVKEDGGVTMTDMDVKAGIEIMKHDRNKSVNLVIKANTDPITIGSSYTGGTVGLTAWDPEFARIVRRMPYLRQIITTRPVNKSYVSWAEQNTATGSVAGTTEANAKNQGTFTSIETQMRLKKRTYFIKTSKENLDDLPFMASEINTELFELLNIDLDDQILDGDNGTNNLKGILSYAPTFNIAGTDLANGVTEANNKDVLRAAYAQIVVNGKGRFMPNYFIIHPWDAAVMDLSKASDGVYVIPPFVNSDGQRISGMIGIENTGIDAGTFLVGDFSKSNLALRNEIQINIGYDGNDFTENLVTVLGEVRAAHYIRQNHVTAFVDGDFSTAKAQLDGSVAS